MAFSIYASLDDTTIQLNDGNPFYFEKISGLSGADVTRHLQRGPLQNGATDLGYRYSARVIEVHLLFFATNDATLDEYRTLLMSVFSPMAGVSVWLSVRRDDNDLRTLQCYPTGDISIDLIPTERAGHLHRAIVRLRAPNPLWRGQQSTSTYTYVTTPNWWLAGGSIDPSQVAEHVENASHNQVYAGLEIPPGQPWTIAVTSEPTSAPGERLLFRSDHPVWGSMALGYRNAPNFPQEVFYATGMAGWGTAGTPPFTIYPAPVKQTWFCVFQWGGTAMAGTIPYQPGTASIYADNVLVGTIEANAVFAYGTIGPSIGGTAQWKISWPRAIAYGAVYNTALNSGQRAALYDKMSSDETNVVAVNSGDADAYPSIYIHGPAVDPIIRNVTTGESVDLTGISISEAGWLRLDLRNGNKGFSTKTYTSGTPTNPIGMADFHLAPAPIASGGSNHITLQVVGAGVGTDIRVEHTNYYTGF